MNGSIRTLTPSRFWGWLAIFAAFLILCAVAGPLVGAEKVDFARALNFSIPLADNSDRLILFSTRIPRVVLALCVGASLAVAGAAMQGILRNPLASPFTLGVASGGTLGAAIAISLGVARTAFKVPGTVLGGFVFSLLTIALVWGLSYRRGRLPTGLLLLAGVSVSFLFGALVMLLQYVSDFTHSFQLIRWMMGSLDTVGYDPVWGVAPVLVIGAIILIRQARAFNLLALGDDAAQTAGVDVKKLELSGFIVSGLLAGAAVSQVGPIGFIGLIVPHTVRLIAGPDYRLVIPGSLLVGGGFLILCDLLSRTILAPVELPPGIITAILGAPFFLSLLRSKAREIAV
jgi:iron complex transport system permease protein